MNYTRVDMTTWPRAELFNFYIEKMRIVMSLTVDIDVAPLLAYTKKHNLKFYPAMLWVVSKVINSHDEFKYSWDADGNLIRWDFVSPSYADFHSEDENFTKLMTEYSESLSDFHARFLADREKHRNDRAVLPNQAPNFFDVSCLPWVRYKHFDVHVFDEGKFLAPVVTWGKYEAEGDKVLMPLTMNIHHAVADGFHLSRFFNEVQGLINHLEEYDRKQAMYQGLINRVRASYPPRNVAYSGKDTQLYWCEDCEEINLWTYWQGRNHLDARIMLVGQDWGCPWDADYLPTIEQVKKANLGCKYDYLNNNPSPTDANLARLFRELGYDITRSCPDLFFTNLILGYRTKGFSGGYKREWAEHDTGFFKELADIIAPIVILCLGRSTFEGVLSALDVSQTAPTKDYNAFIESQANPVAVTLKDGKTAYVFALAHCGAMGTLNRNGKKSTDLNNQLEDWRRIRAYLNR